MIKGFSAEMGSLVATRIVFLLLGSLIPLALANKAILSDTFSVQSSKLPESPDVTLSRIHRSLLDDSSESLSRFDAVINKQNGQILEGSSRGRIEVSSGRDLKSFDTYEGLASIIDTMPALGYYSPPPPPYYYASPPYSWRRLMSKKDELSSETHQSNLISMLSGSDLGSKRQLRDVDEYPPSWSSQPSSVVITEWSPPMMMGYYSPPTYTPPTYSPPTYMGSSWISSGRRHLSAEESDNVHRSETSQTQILLDDQVSTPDSDSHHDGCWSISNVLSPIKSALFSLFPSFSSENTDANSVMELSSRIRQEASRRALLEEYYPEPVPSHYPNFGTPLMYPNLGYYYSSPPPMYYGP